MKIIDISLPVETDMLHWGRKPEVTIVESIAGGEASNVTRWLLGAHTGTHVDAPLHFRDGAMPLDQVPLEILVGPARVVDLTHVRGSVTAADLAAAGLTGCERVLLKTSNSEGPLKRKEKAEAWVGVTPDAAQWLVDNGVRLIAVDYLTAESYQHTHDWGAHQVLLGADVIILENVVLDHVEPGDYELYCLPIKLVGAEAAFARSILVARG
ncbi:MAG: cyclase family protein [Streptosporangiaceae bacterium]|jgi:arylformamidase